jgi:hypothetical protein
VRPSARHARFTETLEAERQRRRAERPCHPLVPYKPREAEPPPTRATNESDEPEWLPIRVQIKAPDQRDPAGVTVEGFYTVVDGTVFVRDTRDKLLGHERVGAGSDPKAVAKRLLKAERGGSFWDPLNYGPYRLI